MAKEEKREAEQQAQPSQAPAQDQPVGLNRDAIMRVVESRLENWKAKGDEIIKVANAIVVKDETGHTGAIDHLSKIKGEKNGIEAAKKSLGDPFRLVYEKINAMFKVIAKPYEDADAMIQKKVKDYLRAKEEAIRQENERRQREADEKAKKDIARSARTGAPPPAPAPPPVRVPEAPKTVAGTGGGTATAKRPWKFEIIDETIIPREYLMPNEKFIRAAVNAGKREIPGVRIYQDIELAIKAS